MYAAQPAMIAAQPVAQHGLQPGMMPAQYGQAVPNLGSSPQGQPGMMPHGQPGMIPQGQHGMAPPNMHALIPHGCNGYQHQIQVQPQPAHGTQNALLAQFGNSPIPQQGVAPPNMANLMPRGDGKFVDPQFPPVNNSISYSKNPEQDHVQDIENKLQGEQVRWRRVGDLLSDDPRQKKALFNNIHPNDIGQGILGNCWLLAGIAVLAEFPGRVKQLFKEQELSSDGTYHIYLYDMVEQKQFEVVIDDYIPCGPDGQPYFTKPRGNEAWILLLEKAVAKWFGSYVQLQGAHAMVPYLFLTGENCKTFTQKKIPVPGGVQHDPCSLEVSLCSLEDAHDITSIRMKPLGCTNEQHAFEELRLANESGYIMTCWTTKEPSQQVSIGGDLCKTISAGDAISSDGIVKNLTYSLVCANYLNADGRTWRVVQLRNPWQAQTKAEWNGDLSDRWPYWNQFPQLFEQLNIGNHILDGMFFMPWERFIERFSDFGIVETPKKITTFAQLENRAASGVVVTPVTRGLKHEDDTPVDITQVKKFKKPKTIVAHAQAKRQKKFCLCV